MNKHLIPERLTWNEVWERAEHFRTEYVHPIETIPVNIEKIIEIQLGLEIIPKVGLKRKCDIEGFLERDLKSIIVDANTYEDPKFESRLRFTFAHEVGHLILHPDKMRKMNFRDGKEWIQFHIDQNDDDILWLERQAKQFAGRLLVPKDLLITALSKQQGNIAKFRAAFPEGSNDDLLESISNAICKPFGVSHEVIKRRIVSERIPFE